MRTVRALRRCDGVVFGGGTLFTDIESVRACWLWWVHARGATFFGKPVYLAGQGIGPFRTRWGEWLARDVVRRAAFVSVRDDASAQRTRGWELHTKVVQTFDPVLLTFSGSTHSERSKNVFVIIPRENSPASFDDRAIALAEGHPSVRIVCMRPDDAAEQVIARRIAGRMPAATIVEAATMPQLSLALADAQAVVTQRYHGAIAALGLGIPCTAVPLAPGDKLDEIHTTLQRPGAREQLLRLAEEGMKALGSAMTKGPPFAPAGLRRGGQCSGS
jgi:polysaccharide pyruvyl transferase WcaK-like protein